MHTYTFPCAHITSQEHTHTHKEELGQNGHKTFREFQPQHRLSPSGSFPRGWMRWRPRATQSEERADCDVASRDAIQSPGLESSHVLCLMGERAVREVPLKKALATVLARFLFDVKFPCLQIFTRFTWRINLHWKLWDFYINFHIFASFHVKFFRGCGIVPWSHKWWKLKVIGVRSVVHYSFKDIGEACVKIKNVTYKFICLFIQSVLLHTCYMTVTISVQEQQRTRHERTHPELSGFSSMASICKAFDIQKGPPVSAWVPHDCNYSRGETKVGLSNSTRLGYTVRSRPSWTIFWNPISI